MALLPPIFVGTACQLVDVVDWYARELQLSLKQLGESLPPWRQRDSLLSRWLPRAATDTPVPASPAEAAAGLPGPLASPASPATPSAADAEQKPQEQAPQQQAPQHAQQQQMTSGCSGALPLPRLTMPAARPAAASPGPATASRRRVVLVPVLSSLTLGGPLGGQEHAGAVALPLCGAPAAGMGGCSPMSPALSWGSCGSSSPVSILPAPGPLPFGAADVRYRAAPARECCSPEGTAPRPGPRALGPVSLLTLQLTRATGRQLAAL